MDKPVLEVIVSKPKPLPSVSDLLAEFAYDPISGNLWRRNGELAGSPNTRGYLRCNFNGNAYKVHRLIWKLQTGEEPVYIDHKNGIGVDNRWVNLRNTTLKGNQGNRRACVKKSENMTGTAKVKNRWLAFGADSYLGSYATEEEAHDSYKKWHLQYFGAMSIYAV
jgi:hypothetical protein